MANYIGIDISKATLDVYEQKLGYHSFENKGSGFLSFREWIDEVREVHVIVEATGGYQRELVEFLEGAGILYTVINPKRARDFAKARGVFAKTDKVDSKVLADFGSTLLPKATNPASREVLALNDLTSRRAQLVDLLVQEKNRLEHSSGIVLKDVKGMISFITRKVEKIEEEIQKLIGNCEELKKKSKLLESVKGVGPIVCSILLSKLPELGKLSGKQIASLVGLAPFADQSGKHKGRRSIMGGRGKVRSVLYMGTLSAIRSNPQIKLFYGRLVEKGKNKKLAITACMRKLLVILNAILQKETVWDKSIGLVIS
jgi:transposase